MYSILMLFQYPFACSLKKSFATFIIFFPALVITRFIWQLKCKFARRNPAKLRFEFRTKLFILDKQSFTLTCLFWSHEVRVMAYNVSWQIIWFKSRHCTSPAKLKQISPCSGVIFTD